MKMDLVLNPTIDDLVRNEEKNLKQFFMVSKVEIRNGIAVDPSGVDISVSLSDDKMCKRCTQRSKTTGKKHKDLCERCFKTVSLDNPQMLFDDFIPCDLFERNPRAVILDILTFRA